MIRYLTLTIASLLAMSTMADAKRSHRQHSYHQTQETIFNNDGRFFAFGAMAVPQPKQTRRRVADANGNNVTYLPHPAGCARSAFCGCGARKHLGIADARLNLASNWPRYYRGSARVAVWRGHVAVIDYMTGPNTAMLYDYNSGGHLSRHHVRSLSGARIIGG